MIAVKKPEKERKLYHPTLTKVEPITRLGQVVSSEGANESKVSDAFASSNEVPRAFS